MRGRLRIIVFVGMMLRVFPLWSQADLQLSQHMFNRLNYNPAVTGASRYVNISGYMRQQWTGWEGAPSSQMLTVHNYFEKVNSGFGFIFIHDAIGLENSVNAKITYAYHVKLSSNSYLSFGLSGGVLYRFFDRGDIFTDDMGESQLPLDIKDKAMADFDVGVEFNTYRFTAGVSVTHVNHTSKQQSDVAMVTGRHFYAFAKYTLPVAYHWELEPSFFTQQNRKFVHSELNLLARYDDRFWFGASFRVNRDFVPESFVPMLGANITEYLRIGYSYDFNMGVLKSYSEGTHEIVLGIRLRKGVSRSSKSPRFFE